MKTFKYVGRDSHGNQVSGKKKFKTKEEAEGYFKNTKVILTVLKEQNDLNFSFGEKELTPREIAMFTRQMYSLMKSGIPLLRAMNGLASFTDNKGLRRVLEEVHEDLTSGQPLANALSKHPKIFNKLYVSIVNVGENTGKLEESFLQLYEHLMNEIKTKEQLTSAIRYPIIVISVVAIALVILNIWVVPTFVNMFLGFGVELPFPTKVLIVTSNFFQNFKYVLLFSLIFGVIFFKKWSASEKGKPVWDKHKLKLPLIGPIIEKIVLGRFCRIFSMALSSGVPISQSLNLTADVLGNEYMRLKVLEIKNKIEGGENFLRSTISVDLFSPLIIQMIAVGEEVGKIDEMLEEVANYMEREVDFAMENLTAAIEPVMLGTVAGIVGILALGIYLPMWDMISAMKNS